MTAVRPSGGIPTWWGRVGPVKRAVVALLVLVVGTNLALAALDSVIGRDPGGPAGSSFATGDDGVAAWSDLLRVRGVAVEPLRRPLGEADLPRGGTVILVQPTDAPTADGVAALAEHLASGGRVVTVGATGAAWAGALVGADLGWQPEGATRPAPGQALLRGLGDLRGTGSGSFATPGTTTAEAGPADRPVVVSSAGLVAVADPTLLDNAGLADGDNAALAVILADADADADADAGRAVAFAEAEHGYGAPQGLGAVPGRWKATVVGLVVAALVGFWSVGQRLGPPDALDRPLPPARAAYVDALGAALDRASAAPLPPERSPEETRDPTTVRDHAR